MSLSVMEFVNNLANSKKANLLRRGLARHAKLTFTCVKAEVGDAGQAMQFTCALLAAQHVNLTALDLKDEGKPSKPKKSDDPNSPDNNQ